ncbi:MAG: hypothetical protein D6737_13095 [Chloroflexi bacterium]|nr:MAG: hypothetical protein CUN54_06225 [Phototrophicales bacterium]RMF78936.1 MAG: hypothetical protein D6737_13095 [Chloroflexota bacterium]
MQYLDLDFAYFLGMVIARGTISESGGLRQVTINFPHSTLEAQGVEAHFDQETSIKLGLTTIRERLVDLLDTDIGIVSSEGSIDLVIRFLHNAFSWRVLLAYTDGKTSFRSFQIPDAFLDSETPSEIKLEFVRGFADVAGNVRLANRYVDKRNRVRLDVLNYTQNWGLPVQLCLLLQDELDIPVQLITWGHPNMNRGFREHQINIFAIPFLKIGFRFQHKQLVLEELAHIDETDAAKSDNYVGCPGRRRLSKAKEPDEREHNDKLPFELRGQHFDAYWQICKALGCPREPHAVQLSLPDPLDSEE